MEDIHSSDEECACSDVIVIEHACLQTAKNDLRVLGELEPDGAEAVDVGGDGPLDAVSEAQSLEELRSEEHGRRLCDVNVPHHAEDGGDGGRHVWRQLGADAGKEVRFCRGLSIRHTQCEVGWLTRVRRQVAEDDNRRESPLGRRRRYIASRCARHGDEDADD